MDSSNWYHESFIDSYYHNTIHLVHLGEDRRAEGDKLNKGSMVINLSFFIKFKAMLNNFNMFFQPYFIVQNPETSSTPSPI